MHNDLIAVGHEVNGRRNILSVNIIMIKAKVNLLLILVNHLRMKRIPSKFMSLHWTLVLLFCLVPRELFNVSLLQIALMLTINLLQVLVDPRISVENLQSLTIVVIALSMHIGAEGRLSLKRTSRRSRSFMVEFRHTAGLAHVPLGEHIKIWYFFHFYF